MLVSSFWSSSVMAALRRRDSTAGAAPGGGAAGVLAEGDVADVEQRLDRPVGADELQQPRRVGPFPRQRRDAEHGLESSSCRRPSAPAPAGSTGPSAASPGTAQPAVAQRCGAGQRPPLHPPVPLVGGRRGLPLGRGQPPLPRADALVVKRVGDRGQQLRLVLFHRPDPVAPFLLIFRDKSRWQNDRVAGDQLALHRDQVQQFQGRLVLVGLGVRPAPGPAPPWPRGRRPPARAPPAPRAPGCPAAPCRRCAPPPNPANAHRARAQRRIAASNASRSRRREHVVQRRAARRVRRPVPREPQRAANALPRSRPNCAIAYRLRPDRIATATSVRIACNGCRRPDASRAVGHVPQSLVQRQRLGHGRGPPWPSLHSRPPNAELKDPRYDNAHHASRHPR